MVECAAVGVHAEEMALAPLGATPRGGHAQERSIVRSAHHANADDRVTVPREMLDLEPPVRERVP